MKTNHRRLFAARMLLLFIVVWTTTLARGQRLELLHSFQGADGSFPGNIVQGSDGNLYGGTIEGGTVDRGTVFRMTPAGALTTLVSFNGANGRSLWGRLLQVSDGTFYGTTTSGGASNRGTIFRMTPAGVLTTLFSFNGTNGQTVTAGLVQGSDGDFYGSTAEGGDLSKKGGWGCGTLFKVTSNGTLTTLVAFDNTNGCRPGAGLVQWTDGSWYGTTEGGGDLSQYNGAGAGTVFKLTSNGALTNLVKFSNPDDGIFPLAGLMQHSDGNFYGTTQGRGTVFKMTPAGVLTTIASFSGPNGDWPIAGLLEGSDGNLYGTTIRGGTADLGTIFRVTPAGALTRLVSFDGPNGQSPQSGLVQGLDGNLYGTTTYGGAYGKGTVYRIVMPAPLKITRSSDVVVITWNTAFSGAVLEAKDALTAGASWSAVQPAPVVIGDQKVVTEEADRASRFYRLKK